MLLARQKTTFVANVSHELKTPLTSIRMFAEMLKERRQPDPQKQEKYLDLMVSETERLTRLINNVLDFARMEKGERKYEKKRLDLALLCEGLVDDQRVRLEPDGFEVSLRNDLGEAFVEGDEEALKQALLNLLSNAEKYGGEAKRIDIEIRGRAGFRPDRCQGPGDRRLVPRGEEDLRGILQGRRFADGQGEGQRAGPADRPPDRPGSRRGHPLFSARGRRERLPGPPSPPGATKGSHEKRDDPGRRG